MSWKWNYGGCSFSWWGKVESSVGVNRTENLVIVYAYMKYKTFTASVYTVTKVSCHNALLLTTHAMLLYKGFFGLC